MFIYLSKKISLPRDVALKSLSWENVHGYLACGGTKNFLKVLKLEVQREQDDAATARGIASSLNVTMNQTLESHTATVTMSAWNPKHSKLATADEGGMIVIWVLYHGVWFEEMVNNRNKSPVNDLRWSPDGEKIIILYADGALIVGSYEGHRLWGKELKHPTSLLSWSPSCKLLVMATASGEMHIYDNTGNFMTKFGDVAGYTWGSEPIVFLDWYAGTNGYAEPDCPCLAIVTKSGKLLLLRSEQDKAPIVKNTGIDPTCMKWNPDGTILAIGGRLVTGDETILAVTIFDLFGNLIRTLRLNGQQLSSISWEHSGLRLALAVDSFIYVANSRPDYFWTYLPGLEINLREFSEGTVCYSHNHSNKNEPCVAFWNLKTGEVNQKNVHRVLFMSSYRDRCALITRCPPDSSEKASIYICDSNGTTLKAKFINFEPKLCVMTNEKIIMVHRDGLNVTIWQYQTEKQNRAGLAAITESIDESRELSFHVDVLQRPGQQVIDFSNSEARKTLRNSEDSICSLCASQGNIWLGKTDGSIMQISGNVYKFQYRQLLGEPQSQTLSVNCDGTLLAVIDIAGLTKIIRLETTVSDNAANIAKKFVLSSLLDLGQGSAASAPAETGSLAPFERKDTWSIQWAEDHPTRFALMEKTRVYMFKDFEPEEPITTSGYMCQFSNLQMRLVLLDEILCTPLAPTADSVVTLDTKSLRDTRSITLSPSLFQLMRRLDILKQVGFADAFQFVEENAHPKLWRLVADAALSALDLQAALKGYVKCQDYSAIQFIKRLQLIEDKRKQEAEIFAYFHEFEKAEAVYLKMERVDMAVDLRVFLGDWFNVLQIFKENKGKYVNEALEEKTKSSLGDYYFERQKWFNASIYYKEGRVDDRLAECYYVLEDYAGMQKIVDSLPDRHPLLSQIADMLSSIGMCDLAVKAHVRAGNYPAALDICVYLQEWELAVQIASTFSLKIDSFFEKYVRHLLDSGQTTAVIELYHKAGYFDESASRIFKVAYDCLDAGKPPVLCKKLFVLAAFEADRYKQSIGNNDLDASYSTLLKKSVKRDVRNGKSWSFSTPWRSAEALHFFILAQTQFYNGEYQRAVATAARLQKYLDILQPRVVYSLIALISYNAKRFGLCSKAFQEIARLDDKQDALEDDNFAAAAKIIVKPRGDQKLEALAFKLFLERDPIDQPQTVRKIPCYNCGNALDDLYQLPGCNQCQAEVRICLESGQIMDKEDFVTCQTCRHYFYEGYEGRVSRRCCPLCHSVL